MILIPCKYQKHDGKKYLSQKEASVKCLHNKVSSAITSHYWRGISCNGDNIILVINNGCDK